MIDDSDGQRGSCLHLSGDVGGLVIAFAWIGKCGSSVDYSAIQVEFVLVIGRDVRPSSGDWTGAQSHLATRKRVVVRLCGGSPNPAGLPICVAKPRVKADVRRPWRHEIGPVPGANRPREGRACGKRGSGVGDKGLDTGRHFAAVPDHQAVTHPCHLYLIGRLNLIPIRVVRNPAEQSGAFHTERRRSVGNVEIGWSQRSIPTR